MGALRRIDPNGCWGLTPARELYVPAPEGFRTEPGDALEDRSIRLRLHGPPDAPVVLAAGGISSGRAVADDPQTGAGWWGRMARPGGGIDLASYAVLGFDFAPALATRPITITTADQARLIAHALTTIGVERLHGFVGASYGGMVALAFAALFPDRLERLCVISAAHRSDPMATAVRGVQRRMLRFAEEAGRPEEGLSLARQLAMTTYRTSEEFRLRFEEGSPDAAGGPYSVCSYLIARGRSYHEVMRPQRWIALSDSMDRHRVKPECIRARTTVVGVTSDRLVPIEDLREMTARAPDARLVEIASIYGHDAFLKETETLTPLIRASLECA